MLSNSTLQVLRQALDGDHANPETTLRLSAAMARAREEAGRAGASASALLEMLRDLIAEVPCVRDAASPQERADAVQRVTSVCIDAYYRDR